MLYGKDRARRGGTANIVKCSQRKWAGDDEIRAFFAELSEANTARSLDMRKCRMAGEGAVQLARVLQQPHSALSDVYLFANELGDAGSVTLAAALETNRSVTKLNLCGNMIACEGAAALGRAMHVNDVLVQCDINCNELCDAGVEALLAGLRLEDGSRSALRVLSLRKNGVTDHGAAVVLDLVTTANSRLVDVALGSPAPVQKSKQTGAPKAQQTAKKKKKRRPTGGLDNTVGMDALEAISQVLMPRSAALKASMQVDDLSEALRRIFTLAKPQTLAGALEDLAPEASHAASE